MMHPEKHQLLAYIDGALEDAAERGLIHHVASCAACRADVSEMRQTSMQLAGVLSSIDEEEPAHWLAQTAPNAWTKVQRPESVETRAPVQWWRSYAPALRRAAVIILLLSGAGSVAALVVNMARQRARAATIPAAHQRENPTTKPRPATAGVTVQPRDAVVIVEINGAASGSHLTITVQDRTDVRMQIATVNAPHVIAARGRVTASLDGQLAQLEVLSPRANNETRVVVDGHIVATIRNGEARMQGTPPPGLDILVTPRARVE